MLLLSMHVSMYFIMYTVYLKKATHLLYLCISVIEFFFRQLTILMSVVRAQKDSLLHEMCEWAIQMLAHSHTPNSINTWIKHIPPTHSILPSATSITVPDRNR